MSLQNGARNCTSVQKRSHNATLTSFSKVVFSFKEEIHPQHVASCFTCGSWPTRGEKPCCEVGRSQCLTALHLPQKDLETLLQYSPSIDAPWMGGIKRRPRVDLLLGAQACCHQREVRYRRAG